MGKYFHDNWFTSINDNANVVFDRGDTDECHPSSSLYIFSRMDVIYICWYRNDASWRDAKNVRHPWNLKMNPGAESLISITKDVYVNRDLLGPLIVARAHNMERECFYSFQIAHDMVYAFRFWGNGCRTITLTHPTVRNINSSHQSTRNVLIHHTLNWHILLCNFTVMRIYVPYTVYRN